MGRSAINRGHIMCGSTVDIQCATAEIRRGKKKEEETRTKIIMSAFAMQGSHNECCLQAFL